MKAGYLNNKNAQKGDSKKEKRITLRVTNSTKALWKQKAQSEGLTLSAWMEKILNEHCSNYESKYDD